jgi:ATP-binding cassette subfamily F protein uup
VLTPQGGGQWLETPGGYADYLVQAGSAAAPRRSEQKPSPVATSQPKAPASKLSYKEARRLEELDRLMPERQDEITSLEDAMADSSLFTKDPKAFHARANRLAAARTELAAFETEWLALEEKREALARG